ncbi:thymidine kinase [Bacillus cereus group sp. Bc015]|uniref:thymidine kinase n=1 Tax=Bacillus cereus group sp. Bc015 TaxID=3018123 RepID=UPI0022E13247|nr:thymidine kinase [Bacillus cereus group sp. Bc015]MDA2738432.1 thymidine kinase [Bacillus cereus group sp. Bc015]
MLTVICGGMFSEKTTELQRRGKRLKRAGKKVAYFKPDFDNRYSENEIVTHDGNKVEAISIPTDVPIMIYPEIPMDTDVVLIDEIQFFDEDIINVINGLLQDGLTVIVAGLDLDFEAKPFGITSHLMALAEEVVKLHAVCSECGDDSWVSYKENNGQRIQLGTDEYTPMCRKCFNNLKKKGTVKNG